MKIVKSVMLMGVIVGLGLAACAPSPVAPRGSTAEIVTPAPATATPIPAPTVATTTAQPLALATPAKGIPNDAPVEALPENVVLTLRREGGFAGRRDLWTVFKTGRIETNKGETQQIGEDAVATLLKDLETAGIFDLKDDYRNPNCADCFEYTLTVAHGETVKTIRANDAGEMPPSLTKIIDRITSDVGNVK